MDLIRKVDVVTARGIATHVARDGHYLAISAKGGGIVEVSEREEFTAGSKLQPPYKKLGLYGLPVSVTPYYER